ncbi:MAG: CxxxxCH/CxxCH domain-containing protein [Myxococcales bacterium]|nr:CxxxxCH/CxxCH domain-containing protein [Myxococcales bacterium]
MTIAPRPTTLALAALTLALAACDLGTFDAGDAGPPAAQSNSCAAGCHGSGGLAAPPKDTTGQIETTARGVGAHRNHLGSSTWHKGLECASCHTVPTEIGQAGHLDTPLPAELTFHGLGANSAWNDADGSCTSYCHGAALTGGTKTTPIWTQVADATPACDTCHGAPPPAPHPNNPDCGTCHASMNPGDPTHIAYPELHIDGTVQVNQATACDACHGTAGQSAPPKDTTGGVATTLRGVGAHAAHVTTTSTWHASITCDQCHKVPMATADLGHVDTPLPAELTFGALAGVNAAWNGTACSNTYCHGGGTTPITGGQRSQPVWTQVDGTQSTCTSCHGMGPPAPHPAGTDCGSCHPTMAPGAGNTTIAVPAQHIDGTVQVIGGQACDACHGSGGNSAPPRDTTMGTATTLRGVGAHRRHLDPSTWRTPIACSACHLVPTGTVAVGHTDTPLPAELTFAPIAGAATWDGTRCSNTYCHGATLAGGTSTNPIWTQVDGAQGQCGSCHGLPPPAPHPANPDCGSCHDTMTAGVANVITDPSRHIDGNVDVTGGAACDSCHGSAGQSAPPRDTSGNTATTARGVGAHRAHVAGGAWHAPVACADCHRVPTASNSVGHRDSPLPAELTFSARAGTTTAWNGTRCSNNYCHGGTLGAGGSAIAPVWTQVDGTQTTCASCHGAPPPAPHPTDPNCGSCHPTMTPGNNTTITDPTRHIDGNVDVSGTIACDTCHGGAGQSAPPKDTSNGTATTLRGVGAHRSHLGTSTWHAEVTCATCHRVPTTVGAVGHRDTALPAELTFTGRAVGTAWNGSTCTNSYCHGATLAAGGSATAPLWTRVNGTQATCTSCHGAPPPAPHVQDSNCMNCHAPVAGPGISIAAAGAAQHIDGTLQVTAVHPAGWRMGNAHGAAFNDQGPASCATAACHGTALTGGASMVSCSTAGCHTNWQTNCVFCHGGTVNQTGAPPASVDGLTAVSDRHVGAHTTHVTASATHAAIACSACHVTPTTALTPGHIDGVADAEVRYSTLNASGTYAKTTATCGALYCHGNGRTSAGTATWTSSTALGCGSCHNAGNNPQVMSGDHKKHIADENMKCSECHAQVVNAANGIIAPALHVDGLKQVQMARGTYTPATRKCTNIGCHGTETW